MSKSILHVEKDEVRFTLPFMEAYLLAKYLSTRPEEADQYFDIEDVDFDQPTFALYAEIGASPKLVESIFNKLNVSISALESKGDGQNILLGIKINPAYLSRPEHLKNFQRRVADATADVVSDRDVSTEKQRLLDATNQIREQATKRSEASLSATGGKKTNGHSVERTALATWTVATSLLGSGAERLDATTKRALIQKIIELSALIIDDWTRNYLAIDFGKIKSEITTESSIVTKLASTDSKSDLLSAKKTIENVLDIMEYQVLTFPFVYVTATLCEEARDAVLAESVFNTKVTEDFAVLLRGLWLSDIDVSKGKVHLRSSIKALPPASFLRVNLASHLIARAYWKHWRKEDRLALLDAANECIKPLGKSFNKSQMKRMIQSEIEEGRSKS